MRYPPATRSALPGGDHTAAQRTDAVSLKSCSWTSGGNRHRNQLWKIKNVLTHAIEQSAEPRISAILLTSRGPKPAPPQRFGTITENNPAASIASSKSSSRRRARSILSARSRISGTNPCAVSYRLSALTLSCRLWVATWTVTLDSSGWQFSFFVTLVLQTCQGF